MADDINPYRAPTAAVADVAQDARAEEVRETHLSTEASLKSVGLLYYLGTIGLFVSMLAMLASPDDGPGLGLGLVLAALCAVTLAVAYGLRGLRPWVRVPAIVLTVLGLFNFPVGTLLSGYVLYLLLNAKGRFVLTSEYAQIVAATPHMKYRSSTLVLVLVVVVLVGIVAAILVPLLDA